jgi:hypothetical protein
MMKATLALSMLVHLSLSGAALAADPDNPPPGEEQDARAEASEELTITLRVPLLSPLFAETPLAVVNDEPITLQDLTRRISSMHEGRRDASTSVKKNYARLLQRIIAAELIVQEAREIGLDETDAIAAQIDSYSRRHLISLLTSKQLASVEPDEEQVDELYRKMSREFLVTTLTFREEEDILSFEEQLRSADDFHDLAKRFIHAGKAQGEIDGQRYMKLKDLLPGIAKAAFDMQIGSTSQIFRAREGFLIFHVDDIRVYEDPALRDKARQEVLASLRRQKLKEYADFLEQKYVTIDEELLDEMSFEGRRGGVLGLGKREPFDYQTLLDDERVLATVHGDESFTVTVADLARALEKKFFHGVDRALDRRDKLNEKKRAILEDILFQKIARMEAVEQGLDQTTDYADAVEEYTNALIFEQFVNKVIAPDVTISEEEVRRYYEQHIGDFSTPMMFRMNGLAFSALPDAEKALDKLRRGADFAWVSANTAGQVGKDTPGVLDFENALLSSTALPKALSERAEHARQGDSLLYSAPDDYHYVIAIAKVFPPEPRDYEKARADIRRIIAEEKAKELIDEWVEKLQDAYETRIFAVGLDD